MAFRQYNQLDDDRVIDAFLIYKYAQFNKPEQDRMLAENPLVELPYVDVEKCNAYNDSLCLFSQLPLVVRVHTLKSPDQKFNTDCTMLGHLSQVVFSLRSSIQNDDFLKNTLERNQKVLPTVEEIYYTMDDNINSSKNQAIFFHLLAIYHSDPTDDYPYPFIEDLVVFNNRIRELEKAFVVSMVTYLSQDVSPAESVYYALRDSWEAEQMDPYGIRINVGEIYEEVIEPREDEPHGAENEHNIAFIWREQDPNNKPNYYDNDYMQETEDEDGDEFEAVIAEPATPPPYPPY
jgi:hypothetical protein